jgi:YihY family inner membrane protein
MPEAPEGEGVGPAALLGRLQARAAAVERRVRAVPQVQMLQTILDTYNAAGGGLVAGGLAFGALFAIVPGLLLVVSLLVIGVDDPATRERVIDWLVRQVPPLEEVAREIVTGLADGARVGTVVGLVAFIWGASGFFRAFEAAMDRVLPGPAPRDPIMSHVRSLIAVALVVVAVMTAFLFSSVASVLWTVFGPRIDPVVPLISPLIVVGVACVVCFAVYRLVPSAPPSWRAALVPALAAGIAIGVLTALFTVLAPLLVGGLLGLGVIASVFIALVWFNWVFQILLYGGAYARLRRDGATETGGARGSAAAQDAP